MTTASSEQPSPPTRSSPPSLRTGGIILAVGGLAIALNAWAWGEDTTFKVFFGLYVLLPATAFALLIWWLFYSRFSWSARLSGIAATAFAVGLFFVIFRIDGNDSVMWPLISLRHTKTSEEIAREYRAKEAAAAAEQTPKVEATPAGEGVANKAPAELEGESLAATEADWPQFRGVAWDSIVRGVTVRDDWDANPPKELWKRPCGLGWSSFAVVGNRLFTQEQIEELEAVVCYDADTGRELWRHTDKARLDTSLGGDGPRATPTFFEGRIYALGGTGLLHCLDAITGEVIWKTDILADAGIAGIGDAAIDWGMSGSPLVDEERVYVNPGISRSDPGPQSVAAYDRKSGKKLWANGGTKAGYAAPRPVTWDGVRQILIFDAVEVAGYEPDTGRKLWSYPFTNNQGINVAQPIPVGDRSLFLSTGYAGGSLRIRVTHAGSEWSAEKEWSAPNQFKFKFNDGVLRDGLVYGLDEGILACLDVASGERLWRKGRYRYGEIVMVAGDKAANDRLIVLTESGEVVLLRVNASGPEELGRFQAIKGTCWNHPVVHRGRLYVRSEQQMACFDISGAETSAE